MPSRTRFRATSGSLVRLLLVLSSTIAPAGCRPRDTEADSGPILLISLDTTRADHIGAYGAARPTPAIDRVASEGMVFENVSAACTTTLPSHVSLLTGTWPTRHGVVRNGYTVHAGNLMLPEILQEAGYRTVGVSAAVALSETLGFAQGFEVWDQDPETATDHVAANRGARRAEQITNAAIAQLDRSADDDRPLFLFVHYVDPHSPYDPPEPFRSQHGPVSDGLTGSWSEIRWAQITHYAAATGSPPTGGIPNALSRASIEGSAGLPIGDDLALARLYAGEVSYMDHHVGRLLDALRERGLYERALILITSDHGETFWEHADAWSHGRAAYETTVRVPLILRLPGAEDGGMRIATPVSNVDVLPTLLDALDLTPPAGLDGASLLAVRAGDKLERDASFSQGPLPAGAIELQTSRWKNERKAQSVRVGSWKYVRTPYLELEELYDLDADPMEQRNLLHIDDVGARARADALRARLEGWLAAADPLPSEFFPLSGRGRDDPAAEKRRTMLRNLEALGYVSPAENQ